MSMQEYFSSRDFYNHFTDVEKMLATTFAYVPLATNSRKIPYNLIKVDDENHRLEYALAGYKENELSVQQEGNKLTIQAEPTTSDEESLYLYRGISRGKFVHTVTLGHNITVDKLTFADGILTINLRKEIPEHLKPKLIPFVKK